MTTFSSIIRSRMAVAPIFTNDATSLMFESPTMTWRRRYFSASAWGSSRVLMIGRDRVVADETPSQMCSARCDRQYSAPRDVCSTFPAPAKHCRETRNGIRMSAKRWNSP